MFDDIAIDPKPMLGILTMHYRRVQFRLPAITC
jgi:hypothetical protein